VARQTIEKFGYPGPIIQEKGNTDEDINQCIKVGCQKWKNPLGVLCYPKIPLRLKESESFSH